MSKVAVAPYRNRSEYVKYYRKKNRLRLNSYMRAWRKKNSVKLRNQRRICYYKNHRHNLAYHYKWQQDHPWHRVLNDAKARCNNVNNKAYKSYGGRGIRCLLTIGETKFLWYRDKAFQLKKPSIDRIDPDRDYTFNNCRFIEFKLNNLLARRTKLCV